MEFLKYLAADVRRYTKKIEGAAYLPWALALRLAGLPRQEVVVFDTPAGSSLVRPLFGGGAVAVDQDIGNGQMQRTYLPLLDLRGKPLALGQEDARDVGDTSNRCRVRAVAMVNGLGLSLWAKAYEGDGKRYAEDLGITPETEDLRKVKPLLDVKEFKERGTGKVQRTQPYLGWFSAVAAARITDPGFWWEVTEHTVVDRVTGEVQKLPAMPVPGKGWMVGVRVHWKGRTHTEWLPIMGVEVRQTQNGPKPMEHQAVAEPTVFAWHSSVMRCLAKAIALATGYGINSYSKEIAAPAQAQAPVPMSERQKQAPPARAAQQAQPARKPEQEVATPAEVPPQPATTPAPAAAESKPASAPSPSSAAGVSEVTRLLNAVRGLIRDLGASEEAVAAWMGVKRLNDADGPALARAGAAMRARLAEKSTIAPTHH